MPVKYRDSVGANTAELGKFMQIVAQQLSNWANENDEEAEKDLFGRSAFNRYYYASFLITREMLGTFKTSWRRTMHASIPELLETGLKKAVVDQINRNCARNLMTAREGSILRDKLRVATTELANLLRIANDARKIADYEPETKIVMANKVIKLDTHKLSSAAGWSNRASSYCKTIRSVWADTGLG